MDTKDIDVLVIGSCMTDLTAYCRRIPKIGETVHGEKFNIGFGGKGGNQCVAAANLGARTAMIAKLGNDLFGENYLKNLTHHKIDTTHVRVVDQMSGVAQISVNENGDNNIVIIAGANNELSPNDVEMAESLIKRSNVVMFQFETPPNTTMRALELCKTSHCYAIVNAAPAVPDFDIRILHLSDAFCVNEAEAEAVTNFRIESVPDAKRAAAKLLSLGCKLPIITLGEKGVVFSTTEHGDGAVHVPVEAVKPIDTTGAGDAFLGAFAFFKSKFSHLSLKEMIKRSCDVAAYSVQKEGTQTSFPNKHDLPSALFI